MGFIARISEFTPYVDELNKMMEEQGYGIRPNHITVSCSLWVGLLSDLNGGSPSEGNYNIRWEDLPVLSSPYYQAGWWSEHYKDYTLLHKPDGDVRIPHMDFGVVSYF